MTDGRVQGTALAADKILTEEVDGCFQGWDSGLRDQECLLLTRQQGLCCHHDAIAHRAHTGIPALLTGWFDPKQKDPRMGEQRAVLTCGSTLTSRALTEGTNASGTGAGGLSTGKS